MNVIPDYIEPLVAYRAWSVSPSGALSALHHSAIWPERKPMEATCKDVGPDMPLKVFANQAPDGLACGHAYRAAMRPPVYTVPHKGCVCGIYAHKDGTGSYIKTAQATANRAWGEVYIWGKVLDHEHGYRAQFAYPKLISTNSPYAAQIEAKYGVPCVFEQPVPISEGDESSGGFVGLGPFQLASTSVASANLWGSLQFSTSGLTVPSSLVPGTVVQVQPRTTKRRGLGALWGGIIP